MFVTLPVINADDGSVRAETININHIVSLNPTTTARCGKLVERVEATRVYIKDRPRVKVVAPFGVVWEAINNAITHRNDGLSLFVVDEIHETAFPTDGESVDDAVESDF